MRMVEEMNGKRARGHNKSQCDLRGSTTVLASQPSFWMDRPTRSITQNHRVRTYLVPQSLTRNNRNLIAYPLIGLEIEGEFRVVSLDHELGRLLDGLHRRAR